MAAPVFSDNSVEGIFSNQVWNYIKDHVNGKVYCNIFKGTLQVSIKQGDSTFRYDVENIVDDIANNHLTSLECAENVVEEYKNFIFERTRRFYLKLK